MRLVYLSPVPWSSFAQRPHKFVEWFHHMHGSEVLWIDPYPTRLPSIEDLRQIYSGLGKASAPEPQISTPPWLSLVQPQQLPIEPIPIISRLNHFLSRDVVKEIKTFITRGPCFIGVGKPSELALRIVGMFPNVISFYDAMDDFPLFYSGWSRSAFASRERRLAAAVGQILVSSIELQRKFSAFGQKATLASNACATEILPSNPCLVPSEGRPVFGYVGTLAQWFDWDLVLALARARPDAELRLIGPMLRPPPDEIPANVSIMPACSHPDAIIAMSSFSVGLIPFKCNGLTKSVDPIKYYEYRAMGLPVISAPFGEMAGRKNLPGVFLTFPNADLRQLTRAAQECVTSTDDISAFRDANSWDRRFDAIAFLAPKIAADHRMHG